jgi:hypothetical protein
LAVAGVDVTLFLLLPLLVYVLLQWLPPDDGQLPFHLPPLTLLQLF